MARRLASRFYEVSAIESLALTISGPDDPLVALDDATLDVGEGTQFTLTPQMLGGSGAHHLLNIVLLFPADVTASGGYRIEVEDANGAVDTVIKTAPDAENTAKVQLMIRVS